MAAIAITAHSVMAAPDSNGLIVEVSGFKNDIGHDIAKLFIPGNDVIGKGVKRFLERSATGGLR
jgi:hypothetical protein